MDVLHPIRLDIEYQISNFHHLKMTSIFVILKNTVNILKTV